MRPLIYYVATTLDGFIAHEDGSFDGFIFDEDVVQDFIASYDDFDAVLMGRKTYDVGLEAGKTSPYPMLAQYVFSRSMADSPDPAVQLIREDAVGFVRTLKQQPGKPIWLCGGGNLATQLFKAGLIDEVMLKLNPVVFGKGIPLFEGGLSPNTLTLTNQKTYACGVLLLRYDIGVTPLAL